MNEAVKLMLSVIIKHGDNIEVMQKYNWEIDNCYGSEEKIKVCKKFLADDFKLE